MTSFAQTPEILPQRRWILLCDMSTHLTERDLWAISKWPYHTLKQINSHPTVTECDKWKMCYIAGTADFDHYIQIMFIRQVSWNQVHLRNTKHPKIKHLQKAFSTNCVFSKNLYLYQKNNKTRRTRNEDSSDKNVWICFKLQENKVKVTKHRDL